MSVVEYEDKSVLLTLFETIRDRIKETVTEISEVVVFSDQEGNEDKQRPFAYPYVSLQLIIDWQPNEAIGVSVANPAVSGVIGRQSKGTANIIVHTMFNNRNDDTPAFLENEQIRHKVHRAIHLMSNDPFYTELIKVQDQVPLEIDASQDYMTTYVCMVKEGVYINKQIGSIDTIEVNGNDMSFEDVQFYIDENGDLRNGFTELYSGEFEVDENGDLLEETPQEYGWDFEIDETEGNLIQDKK